MSAVEVGHLPLAVLALLVWLLEEEFGPLHPVDVHEFVARLRHGQVVGFALLEPSVEVFKLLELGQDVVDIADLDGGRLGDLLLQLLVKVRLIVLLGVIHGRAHLVLLFKHFHLLVLAPNHDFQSRLALETVHDSLMEVEQVEFILGQEVLNIFTERLIFLLFFPVVHALHKSSNRLLLVHHPGRR